MLSIFNKNQLLKYFKFPKLICPFSSFYYKQIRYLEQKVHQILSIYFNLISKTNFTFIWLSWMLKVCFKGGAAPLDPPLLRRALAAHAAEGGQHDKTKTSFNFYWFLFYPRISIQSSTWFLSYPNFQTYSQWIHPLLLL